MDTRNGLIFDAERVATMDEVDRSYMRPMKPAPTPAQRSRGKVGRNDPCPCGGGRKFKRCCLWRPVPVA